MKRGTSEHPSFVLPEIVNADAGVDWLTCTQIRAGGTAALQEEVRRVVFREVEAGNDRRTWKGQGYYGERAGGASWGVREDTYLAVLTSDCARDNWQSVSRWATNCSRIDLQVTLLLGKPDIFLFDQLEAHFLALPARRGRVPDICRVRDNKGGNTIYIGSRTSDKYLRIYDKGVEGKTNVPGELIRFEVEYKRGLAKQCLTWLSAEQSPTLSIAQKTVAAFKPLLVEFGGSPLTIVEVARAERIPDNKRRLAYLSKCVRPLIDRLRESGLGDEAMKILFD